MPDAWMIVTRTTALCLAAALLPAPARAQSRALMDTYAYQFANSGPATRTTFASRPISGCGAFGFGAGSHTFSCDLANAPGTGAAVQVTSGATATATGLVSFDPATASFKSGVTLSSTGFTLSQTIPQFDPIHHDQIFDDQLRPDALGVLSNLQIRDQLAVHPLPGYLPDLLDLSFAWDGTLSSPGHLGQPAAPVITRVFEELLLCIGPTGGCGGPRNRGTVFESRARVFPSGLNLPLPNANPVYLEPTPPPGAVVPPPGVPPMPGFHTDPYVTFTGVAGDAPNQSGVGSSASVIGVLTFKNIPIAALYGFDFWLSVLSEIQIQHPSARPVACPVATCGSKPPDQIVADFSVDFTHTLALQSYQVFDAAGQDITNAVSLGFASGLVATPDPDSPPIGPSAPPVTPAPEPATLVLLATGLAAVAAGHAWCACRAACSSRPATFPGSPPRSACSPATG